MLCRHTKDLWSLQPILLLELQWQVSRCLKSFSSTLWKLLTRSRQTQCCSQSVCDWRLLLLASVKAWNEFELPNRKSSGWILWHNLGWWKHSSSSLQTGACLHSLFWSSPCSRARTSVLLSQMWLHGTEFHRWKPSTALIEELSHQPSSRRLRSIFHSRSTRLAILETCPYQLQLLWARTSHPYRCILKVVYLRL